MVLFLCIKNYKKCSNKVQYNKHGISFDIFLLLYKSANIYILLLLLLFFFFFFQNHENYIYICIYIYIYIHNINNFPIRLRMTLYLIRE